MVFLKNGWYIYKEVANVTMKNHVKKDIKNQSILWVLKITNKK
jgi:hypothetical protein